MLASVQQELNRLTTKQKALTRKEKTHQKIVLGGEVAKHLGLDINHDLLVGFLQSFASSTEVQRNAWLSNGARARHLDAQRNEQKNKNYIKKHRSEKKDLEGQDKVDKDLLLDIKQKESTVGAKSLQYNHFSRTLGNGLSKKKAGDD